MERSLESEFLDRPDVPEAIAKQAYAQLTTIHRFVGDVGAILSAIRRDPFPVRHVLDIGCADGGCSKIIQEKLGVEVTGIDRNPIQTPAPVRMVAGDAVHDPLPEADIAFCMHMAHHLEEGEVAELIRNAGRSCRRFLLLDLVRHPLPAALFRCLIAPFSSPVVASDGRISFRRAYTVAEMNRIARRALSGNGARLVHSVSAFYVRQLLDIVYRPRTEG